MSHAVRKRNRVGLLVAFVLICNIPYVFHRTHLRALLSEDGVLRLMLPAHNSTPANSYLGAAAAENVYNKAATLGSKHAAAAGGRVSASRSSAANTSDPYSTAMPWRPLSSIPKQGGRQPWMVPLFVISAFWVPQAHGAVPEVRLVVAFDKAYSSSANTTCVFTTSGSDATTRAAFSMPGHSLLDGMFVYSAGYASCSTAGLQAPHAQGQLHVTLSSGQLLADDSAALLDESWAPVEVIPDPTPEQQEAYTTGVGAVAACTAPVHEDGFAASIVEWAEFHRLVGVEKVFVYDFNSGPLLKPQLDYYARQGLFEVFEWIIPTQIMSNPDQECLLPFFHPSVRREQYGAGRCSMHQDVYQIAWWGQPLALFDCVMRARARHRWVAVLDFDEYIVPKQAPTLSQLFQQIHSSTGHCNAQYTFPGSVVCSGCRHKYHRSPGTQNITVPDLHVTEAPHANASTACLQPAVGFHHMLWSSMTADASDHVKSVIDPMAVTLPGVHSRTMGSFKGCQGTVALSKAQGVKLHDRAHDIHRKDTFMTQYLPLLWEHVSQQHNTGAITPSQHFVPLSSRGCAAHRACGDGAPKSVDFTMCNAFGTRLSMSIDRAVASMFKDRVFDSWWQQNASVANVYGRHTLDHWGPPKQ